MKQKKRKRLMIVVAIAAFFVFGIVGNIFILSQHTQGPIDLPDNLPSRQMMAHIAANLEQLSEADGPFTLSAGFGIVTALDYTDDSGLTIMITLEANAAPEDVLSAEPEWQGSYLQVSDLFAAMSGSGKYDLFFVGTQGPLVLTIAQSDAPSISAAPLETAMSIISSVIGTPWPSPASEMVQGFFMLCFRCTCVADGRGTWYHIGRASNWKILCSYP